MSSKKYQIGVEENEPHLESKNDFTAAASQGRRLGLLERYMLESERINGLGTVTSALLLDSTQELNQEDLRKALDLLPKRYPLLRMRIKESGGDETCFEEMENPDTVNFELLDKITANDWIEGLEEELNGYQFDIEKGPLWRVRLLKETFNEGKFRNALVFTFLHVFCDALSVIELQKKLLEFLTSFHDGQQVEVESLPFRPPLESMASVAPPSTMEKMLFWSFFTLQRAKTFFVKPKNLFLSVYPPVANTDPSVTKKTCLLARSLSEEETKLLINGCKDNKCTVHGAVTASTHLAIARILHKKKHDLKIPVSVDSSYTINARKDCEPKVNSDEFGVYISVSCLTIPVPLVQPDDKQGFWQFARACTREVHTQLDSKEHQNFLKLFYYVDIPSFCKMSSTDFNEGRRIQILNISNCGALKSNQSEDSPYKFTGSYFGVQGARMSHTFGNNIMTVDGLLYWAVEYFPHVTSKTQAEDFFDLSLEIMKQVCVQ